MIIKKFLQVTSDDIDNNITFSYDTESKKVTLVAQGETSNDILPLGEMKDENDPTAAITLLSGTGITIGDDNSINVNQDFLRGFVANLGYLPISSNMDVTADEQTILMNVEDGRVLSVNTTWLDSVINSKGFALTSELPVDVSELNNDVGYLTGVDLTDYAHLSDIPAIPTKVTAFENDAEYATSAYVTGQVNDLATGAVATNTADIATVSGKVATIEADYLKAADATATSTYINEVSSALKNDIDDNTADIATVSGKVDGVIADYTTSAYVTGQVNDLATGAVATNTADIATVSSKVDGVIADYTTSAYVTGQVNDLATGAVATNTADIATVSGKVAAIEADYLKAANIAEMATTGYVDDAIDALANGAVLTNSNSIAAIEADYTTSGFVTDQVNALAIGAVASNTADIATVNGKVEAIEADYLKAANIAQMATTGYVTGQVNALATGAVAGNTANIEAIAADYTTSGQVAEIVEGYGYVTTDTTYEQGTGVTITSSNIVEVDQDFLRGFVGNLGYLPISSNLDVTADMETILMDIEDGRKLSVNSTWLNTFINDKNFLTEIPAESKVEISGAAVTAANSYTDDVLTSYALKSELPTSNSGFVNDANYATSAYVTEQVNALAEGAVADNVTNIAAVGDRVTAIESAYLTSTDIADFATTSEVISAVNALANGAVVTNTNSIEAIQADYTTSAYVTGVVNTLATGTVAGNTADIATVSSKVEAIESAYLTDEDIADFATEDYVTGAVNTLATGAVATNTANIEALGNLVSTLSGEVAEVASDYTTNAQVSSIVEGYGYITGIANNALLSDIPTIPTNVSDFENDAGYLTGVDLTDYAQLSDIPVVPSKVSELNNDKSFVTLADLEAVKQSLLQAMIPTNMEVVTTEISNINEPTKNVFIDTDETLSSNTSFTGKSITVTELSNEDSYVKFTSTGDVTISNLTNSGTLEQNETNGNTQVAINTPGRVVITDSTVAQTGYNAVEIGLANATEPPKSVLIDGVDFTGSCSNNAINIFGTADDAVVTISNCTFAQVSNAVRLSNRTNASGVIINIENCQFTAWEGDAFDPTGKTEEQIAAGYGYAGMILCQDYTSQTAAEAVANNLFGNGKIAVNIINCTHNGTKIEFSDPATVCGSKNANQLIYVYADKIGLVAYDASKFPVISAQ